LGGEFVGIGCGGGGKVWIFFVLAGSQKKQSTSQNHENQNLMAYVGGHFWT
jgi:hypothetical protein